MNMALKYAKESDGLTSSLQMSHIVFDELSFKRLGFTKAKDESSKTKVSLGTNIGKIEDGTYKVSLKLTAENENEYVAYVIISAYCKVNEDDELKERLLKENAVAILYPYARAEMTLLTAQPETDALTLPVLNVTAMVRSAEMEHEDGETKPSNDK